MDQEPGGPVVPTQEEKTHALLCWVLGIFIGVISPIIFMLVGKDKPFVYKNSMQCLTYHIVLIILWIVLGVVAVVTFGLGMLLYPLLMLLNLVVGILGGVAANGGKVFELPGISAIAKSLFKV